MNKRNGEIKGVIFCLITTLTIVGWLVGSATQAVAETTKYKLTSYITYIENLPVGDTAGHVLSVSSRKGLALFENGEVAIYTNWSTLDFIKGNGSVQGYSILTYPDGSTTVHKIQGTIEAGIQKLTGEFIRGTGKFEGIKGSLSITGKSMTPYSKEKGTMGDAYYDITATYTFLRSDQLGKKV